MDQLSREIKCAHSRCSDQNYYLTKLLGKVHQIKNPNPIFTKTHEKMKHTIFDIPNNNTCFITGQESSGVGDHIYEINGYFKKTGKRGINDPWNIIPVCGKLNKSYKIFKFDMDGVTIKKDVGYEELTDDELYYLLTSEDEKEIEMGIIYCKLSSWKSYVKLNGARMMYEEDEKYINIRNKFHSDYKKLWDSIIEYTMSELNPF